MSDAPIILYTHTDEAPALATFSLLPILEAFVHGSGIRIETRDISLSGRILASFSDLLPEGQRFPDALQELGRIAKTPSANIIKLPNISASTPQLKEAIAELQRKGFDLPDYVDEPTNDKERAAKERYDRVKGSAVNPVLREGNSDRRAPAAVKAYARAHPPKNAAWASDCKAQVASMKSGDFFGNEQSALVPDKTTLRIELTASDGTTTTLKKGIEVAAHEIIDATFMDKRALVAFYEEQVRDAKVKGLLFSLHLKATMMKVSDPILFGYAVRAYFADVFEKHGDLFHRHGIDERQGLATMLAAIEGLEEDTRAAVLADIEATYAKGPALAMVNSDKGITNLHVPSDVIIDASMPVLIRDGGKMWNAQGRLQDAKAVIPDRSYASVYQAVIDDCRTHGALDPKVLGSVSNVGLMAQKAEEYGSHDKTFEIKVSGTVRVVDAKGAVLTEHQVQAGDIWRMCTTTDAAVQDWVKLAVQRARATKVPAVFWLDRERAHDARLIQKVELYLQRHDTTGLDFPILAPVEATRFSLERIRRGEDTISVSGNVLRDYLTDLFPILEVGTSAKMLSIVPLMEGGGLFETGAGGSAPKHVEQFLEEGHLRWDSLGEFLALAASFEHIADRYNHAGARLLASTLDAASASYLLENRAPSRKATELDNRGSHYWLARYWARALADQTVDGALAGRFAPMAAALEANEAKILDEIAAVQGKPVDLGGYYRPDHGRASAAMRPSPTLNSILSAAVSAA